MKAKYSLLSQDDFDLGSRGGEGEESGALLGGLADMWGGGGGGPSQNSASHDRPEKSVSLRLYTMQKHHFFLAFAIFFSLFMFSVTVGWVSPDMVERTHVKASQVKTNSTSNVDIPAGPFVMKSPKMSRYNQQLWLMVRFILENNDEAFTKNFTVMLSVVGLKKGLKKGDIIGYRKHNRTRSLECVGATCKSIILMHLGQLPDTEYLVNASLFGFDHQSYNVKDLLFTWATYNPAFTQLELAFRFIFFLLTLGTLVMFVHSLQKFPVLDWSMEQRWMLVLLILLSLYNNPFFPLTLTSSPLLAGVLDSIFQSSFLFSLLMFWLCVLHGLRQTRRPLLRFYAPKFFLVFLMWLSALTMEITQQFNEVRDPTYSFQINTAHYHRFRILFFVLFFIYTKYAVYLTIKAFVELRSMQFIQTRLRFITGFMGVIIILCVSIVYVKFGFGVLEDNFVSRLYTSYDSATQFVSFYALLNLYVYMMVYVYTPSAGREVRHRHTLTLSTGSPAGAQGGLLAPDGRQRHGRDGPLRGDGREETSHQRQGRGGERLGRSHIMLSGRHSWCLDRC